MEVQNSKLNGKKKKKILWTRWQAGETRASVGTSWRGCAWTLFSYCSAHVAQLDDGDGCPTSLCNFTLPGVPRLWWLKHEQNCKIFLSSFCTWRLHFSFRTWVCVLVRYASNWNTAAAHKLLKHSACKFLGPLLIFLLPSSWGCLKTH